MRELSELVKAAQADDSEAYHALKHQDPHYKVRVDAEARRRGIERGSAITRTRQERAISTPCVVSPPA